MKFNFNIENSSENLKRKEVNPEIESFEAKEKNPTQLLISRVNSPEIFKQIVDTHLLFLNEADRHKPDIRNKVEELVKYSIEEVSRETPIQAIPDETLEEMGFNETDPRSEFDDSVAYSIPIDLALDDGKFEEEVKKPWARELLVFNDDFLERGIYQPDKLEASDIIIIKSITELHEKGHMIRRYKNSEENSNLCSSGFDMSKVKVTNEMIEESMKINEHIANEYFHTTPEKRLEGLKGYVFSDNEIIERMSQLKSYFGFSSNESFTEEHLEYARENYIKDTKFNNNMDIFFSAITEETINDFLKIINNYGV